MPVVVAETVAEVRRLLEGKNAALVPTMGALHEGHLALVARAAELAETVVVSIFVNPLQFGPNEDLAKYPRTLAQDIEKLEAAGVAIVFAPSVEEMYPDGPLETRVTAGPVGSLFEGSSRPGHFDGVLTVVAKLLNIVRPAAVLFGQKDAQQVFLVERMTRDLSIPVRVEIVQAVREGDGLALSSRNRFLADGERHAALALSAGLRAAASAAVDGLDAALVAGRAAIAGEGLVHLDYLAVVDPETFLPVEEGFHGAARMIVAARLGTTRLIDNEGIVLG